jgi:hypothetical protein
MAFRTDVESRFDDKLSAVISSLSSVKNDLQRIALNKVKKGTTTAADMAKNYKDNDLLKDSPMFTKFLETHRLFGWIDADPITDDSFPPLHSAENPGKSDGSEDDQKLWKTGTQYFVDNMMARAVKDHNLKEYEISTRSTAVRKRGCSSHLLQMKYASTYKKVSYANRKPDGIVTHRDRDGQFDVAMIVEIKGRYSNGDFVDADVGQVMDMQMDLMNQVQRHRPSSISILTDGFRFKFFKCSRHMDELVFEMSSLFSGLNGWQVSDVFYPLC